MHWSSELMAAGLCLFATYFSLSVDAANWAEKFGDNINLTLYLKDKNVTFNINDSATIPAHPGFRKALPTVLYMHGYTESNQSRSVGLVANAFLKRGDYNFILVDWNHYVTFPYVKAFFNLFQVSHALAKSITRLVQAGVRRETLWVVAHSLGGQLAGVTAKNLDFKLSRITALDPALPGFTFDGIPNLGPKDAEFVDVIHTDSGYFGFDQLIGHVDFFPNNGTRVQPGCPSYVTGLYDGHCSHHRSWDFFAESLLNETAFPAAACSSWTKFTAGECNTTDTAYMGIKALDARNKRGRYYLETAGESPFGKGKLGIANLTTSSGSVFSTITGLFGSGSNQEPLPTNWGWDQ